MKCYILEMRLTREDLVEELEAMMKAQLTILKAQPINQEAVDLIDSVVLNTRKKLLANPEGLWQGTDGKTTWGTFKHFANNRVSDDKGKHKFRVMTAEIPDGSYTWLGYKNAEIFIEEVARI